MKKSERIISALVAMVVGILFVILKDDFIGILMTIVGLSLIVLGVVDIIHQIFSQAIIKIISGIVLMIAGWVVVEAVLYILSGILLIFGTLCLYDKIKRRVRCEGIWLNLLEYATPAICIAIGGLLLLQGESLRNIICIVSGLLAVVEGGVLLIQAFIEE